VALAAWLRERTTVSLRWLTERIAWPGSETESRERNEGIECGL
jgi:hypothetical protein